MEYQIKQKDIDEAKTFAESQKSKSISNADIDYYFLGKLGEIAYRNWHGSSVKYSNTNKVTDFTRSDGIRLAVTTVNKDTKWAVFNDWEFDVLVVLRKIEDRIFCINEVSKDQLKKIAKPSRWRGWFFNPLKKL